MKCPQCGNEYVCPCKSCRNREPDKVPWIVIEVELESCPQCLLTKHVDEWMDIEYEQYEKTKTEAREE